MLFLLDFDPQCCYYNFFRFTISYILNLQLKLKN